ncbi:MAG: tetratricopeptide repeat protein [Magnetospirillum sp.]|nr:tetratricopeptide repeat protein [Magnetospirillum sp.]
MSAAETTPEAEIARLSAIVAQYRTEAAADPESLFPGLADSLVALGARLADVGRGEEALAATQEGAEQFRALSESDPATFTVHLASALNNLSNRLTEANRDGEARGAGDEAVRLAERAVVDHPAQARFVWVSSLMNQAGRSWRVLDSERALADMTVAVDVFREGGADTTPFLNVMIEALHRNAMALTEAQMWPEAVAIRRLTGRCFPPPVPAAVHHLEALTLEQAAFAASRDGRPGDSLPLAEEAAQIAASIAAAEPDEYRLFHAQTLGSLASRQYEAQAMSEAMESAIQAIQLFQDVAQTDAAAAVVPLAMTLETFAAILTALGHGEQADAVRTQRDQLLAAADELESAQGGNGGGCGGGCSCG